MGLSTSYRRFEPLKRDLSTLRGLFEGLKRDFLLCASMAPMAGSDTRELRNLKLDLRTKREAVKGSKERTLQLIAQAKGLEHKIFMIECHEAEEKPVD